jgi:hypothetical protein
MGRVHDWDPTKASRFTLLPSDDIDAECKDTITTDPSVTQGPSSSSSDYPSSNQATDTLPTLKPSLSKIFLKVNDNEDGDSLPTTVNDLDLLSAELQSKLAVRSPAVNDASGVVETNSTERGSIIDEIVMVSGHSGVTEHTTVVEEKVVSQHAVVSDEKTVMFGHTTVVEETTTRSENLSSETLTVVQENATISEQEAAVERLDIVEDNMTVLEHATVAEQTTIGENIMTVLERTTILEDNVMVLDNAVTEKANSVFLGQATATESVELQNVNGTFASTHATVIEETVFASDCTTSITFTDTAEKNTIVSETIAIPQENAHVFHEESTSTADSTLAMEHVVSESVNETVHISFNVSSVQQDVLELTPAEVTTVNEEVLETSYIHSASTESSVIHVPALPNELSYVTIQEHHHYVRSSIDDMTVHDATLNEHSATLEEHVGGIVGAAVNEQMTSLTENVGGIVGAAMNEQRTSLEENVVDRSMVEVSAVITPVDDLPILGQAVDMAHSEIKVNQEMHVPETGVTPTENTVHAFETTVVDSLNDIGLQISRTTKVTHEYETIHVSSIRGSSDSADGVSEQVTETITKDTDTYESSTLVQSRTLSIVEKDAIQQALASQEESKEMFPIDLDPAARGDVLFYHTVSIKPDLAFLLRIHQVCFQYYFLKD